jgi:cobaltochelatase CobT
VASPSFPSRTLDAVSACTRALAGAPGADALIERANAATIGGLRAFGDRLAVRQRFHDPATHQQHRPSDPASARHFDDLEQARLDTLGVRWLAGMAANLLAHPGADRDGLRWLAFEVMSGTEAAQGKTEFAAVARAGLPAALLRELADLGARTDDQHQFAVAAADWVRRAADHLPAETHEAAGVNILLPTRTVSRKLPTRGDPGATSAPLSRRTDGRTQDSAGEAGAAGTIGRTGSLPEAYRAYTTAHDRIVTAAALASREELEQLRVTLEAELASVRSVVARLAKRLMRVLMARQTREWQFDLEEGVVDGSRLAPLVASRGAARPFKEERESRFPSTVVTLLIDHSGSMRGRPMRIAALTVEVFARVLERCGVKCEVLGFTTRDWDGGEPAKQWAADGYPENPGRLNALEHIVVKGADVPWRRARIGLGLFLRDEMLKENIDGEALAWAHARLLARAEARRILVVVSDGTPMDEATMAANGHEYLEAHLQAVIEGIETRSPVQLAAIGIGHDVSAFYRNATKIARIDDLGPALTGKLIALLGAGA